MSENRASGRYRAAAWMLGTVGLLAAWFSLYALDAGKCGGDGGEPRAELGSPRHDFCDVAINGPLAVIWIVVPALVTAIAFRSSIARANSAPLVTAAIFAAGWPFVPQIIVNGLAPS